MQDVRLISLTPLAGSRGRVATSLARAIGDNDLLIMLSGPEGSGKSAILAAVVATLAYGGMRVIRVSNPDDTTMGQRELAARILGRPTMGSPAQLVAEAITNLLATTDDGQVVLVVDDAHTLSDQAMELLLVITSPARRGLRSPQLVLAGRGAFWDRPWRDELRAITDQAEKIMLEPLTAEDAHDFVMDEVKASGGTIASVTPDALVALVRCSSGLNAQMDRIVTAAVALGNSRRAAVLTEEIVDAAVTPDTLLEGPCTGAGPLTEGAESVIVPTTGVPAPVAHGKFRVGWLGIAAVVLVIVAGAAVGLVSTLRTQVTPSIDRTASVSPPAQTSEAATAPEPLTITQPVQPRPAEEAGVVAGSPTPTTTPDTTSAGASAPPNAADSPLGPSVTPPSVTVTSSEPSTAAQDAGHPPAAVTTSGDQPIVSAPQPVPPPDHAGDARFASRAAHSGDQQTATHSALSESTADVQAALPHAPEIAKLEPPAVAPATSPAVATTSGLTQPFAPPAAAPPSIAPLPTAPPPIAMLPAVPPPAVAPAMVPPQAALPPSAPTHPDTASLPPSVIAVLLQHGNEKLGLGDILSARLYFERAGAAGSEEGAMSAGRTYDPAYLASVDAPGLQADVKRAIDWYRVAAAAHGNPEAQKRIDALTASGAR